VIGDLIISLFFVMLFGAIIGLLPVYTAALFSTKSMTGVWATQAVLTATIVAKLGTSAWTNQNSFSEPGEWMLIQTIETVLAVALVFATGYCVIMLRSRST